MVDGAGWVTVRGGISQVDVDSVRLAAQSMDRAAGALRNAALRLGMAAASLEAVSLSLPGAASGGTSVRQGGPGGALVCVVDPRIGVQRALSDDVRVLRARLDADAERCARRSLDLLQAAGLYEQSESFAERLAGVGAAAISHWVSSPLGMVQTAGAAIEVWAVDKLGGGWLSRWWAAHDEAVERRLLRDLGPMADELVAGTSIGITTNYPFASRFDFSPRGAAGLLTRVADLFAPPTGGTARRLSPAETDTLLGAGDDADSIDSIPAALDRFETLYQFGADDGDPDHGDEGQGDRDTGALVAVQKVEHGQGPASWVVVIPGTQAAWSRVNPADALADGQSAAGEVTDYQEAVMAVLDDAGAGPGEPIVLVGHSLGGMVARQMAASPAFQARYTLGGLVTAGSPAHQPVPAGTRVISIVNEQELVSVTDGTAAAEDAAGDTEVVISADLGASPDPADQAAAGDFLEAHHVSTHARTFDAASGDARVRVVADPIEGLMTGTRSTTTFYEARRVAAPTPAPGPSPVPGPVPAPHAPALPIPVPGTSPLLETLTPSFGTVAPLSASGPSSGRAG